MNGGVHGGNGRTDSAAGFRRTRCVARGNTQGFGGCQGGMNAGSNYNGFMLTFTLAALLVAQVPPEKANATFTVSDPELEWSLWASEPLFCNPTCMDIDHIGRVWVCESVNYRSTAARQDRSTAPKATAS